MIVRKSPSIYCIFNNSKAFLVVICYLLTLLIVAYALQYTYSGIHVCDIQESTTSEYFFSQCRHYMANPVKNEVLRNVNCPIYFQRTDSEARRNRKKHKKYYNRKPNPRVNVTAVRKFPLKERKGDSDKSDGVISECVDMNNDTIYTYKKKPRERPSDVIENNKFRLHTGSLTSHRKPVEVRQIYMPCDTANVGLHANMEGLTLVDDQWVTETMERAVQPDTMNSSGNTPGMQLPFPFCNTLLSVLRYSWLY